MSGLNEIHLVTRNLGKLKELKKFLNPLGIEVKLLERDFVEVQSDSLEGVVLYGVKELASREGLDIPFVKDDSGLFIASLGNFPGVYSSHALSTIGNKGILRMMEGEKDRRALFKTVIGLYIPSEGVSLFRGECPGSIAKEERGKQGFGFDPIFVPEGSHETFAEMSMEEKNAISHRTRAALQMANFLKGRKWS